MPDPSTVILQAACIVLLVTMSAFFSASETAFTTLNILRIKNYTGKKKKKASRAVKIAEDYGNTLTAILVGNNIVNIGAATLGTLFFTTLFGAYGAVVSTVVITLIVLVFGEILPKNFAKVLPEDTAMALVSPLSGIIKALSPLTWLFNKFRGAIVKENDDSQPSVTEEELKQIIGEIEEEGVLGKQESELVQSALDFDETVVSKILTPRVDIVALDINDGIEGLSKIVRSEHFSRVPVYKDTIDDIVGIIHCQDFLAQMLAKKPFTVTDIMVKPIYVPSSKKISELMRELQKRKNHIAIVTDQYGGTMGLVTLEDIIEELVGEIWDEHDVVEQDIVEVSDNIYEVDGDMDINDLLESLDCKKHEDTMTVGGYIMEHIERIPECGESFIIDYIRFTIVETDDQRITKVSVTPLPRPSEDSDGEK